MISRSRRTFWAVEGRSEGEKKEEEEEGGEEGGGAVMVVVVCWGLVLRVLKVGMVVVLS